MGYVREISTNIYNTEKRNNNNNVKVVLLEQPLQYI